MDILSAVFPVFLVVLCGFFLRHYRFLDETFVKMSNGLIYYFLLPALLFYKIGTSTFDVAFNPALIFGSYLATVAVWFLAYAFGGIWNMIPSIRGTFAQGSFRGNLAYIGLPVVYNAVGDNGLRKAAVLLGFMVPLLIFLAIVSLLMPHRDTGERDTRGMFREIVTNPLMIASFIGIIWSYFEINIPLIISRTLEIFSSATLPLALLCLGGSFDFKISRGSYLLAGWAVFFKNLLLPCIAVLAFRVMGLMGSDMLTGVVMMGAPTAVITYVFAYQLKGDPGFASTIVVLSTLASSLTITMWIYFLRVIGWA